LTRPLFLVLEWLKGKVQDFRRGAPGPLATKEKDIMATELYATEEITIPLAIIRRMAVSQPLFTEMNYAELVAHLDHYSQQLYAFMTTPAVINYADLAALRRRAVGPKAGSGTYNRFQTQLRLAADLLRLGRRTEGYGLLHDLERRLTETEKQPGNLGYLLWSALLRSAAGDKEGAFKVASQLSSQATDLNLDTRVVTFFAKPLNAA
jgi:hypothetical protein